MITLRQHQILNIIVSEYISGATPIASDSIVRKHGLGVSSATVRNDVAELEEQGYITRPHTSAGSVPLDKGYRLYVESIPEGELVQLSQRLRRSIRNQLAEVEYEIDAWASEAAGILAQLVQNLAIATLPKEPEARVKSVNLVPLQEFLVMVIVVLSQARMRRQLLRLKEPVSKAELEASSNKLTDVFAGRTWAEITSGTMVLSQLESEVVANTVGMLQEEDKSDQLEHHVDGLHNLLAQPEFSESILSRVVVQGIEDGSLIKAILDEAPAGRLVRVVIGQENRGDTLWPLSVVIGRYGSPGQTLGSISVVGPVRMHYSRSIAAVELMMDVMDDLVSMVNTR